MRDYRVVIDFGRPFTGAEITYANGQARLTVPFASKASAEQPASEVTVTVTVQDAAKVIDGVLVPAAIEAACPDVSGGVPYAPAEPDWPEPEIGGVDMEPWG